MNRILYVFCCFLWAASQIFAQGNDPAVFLEPGTRWRSNYTEIRYPATSDGVIDSQQVQYFLSEDSIIINNKKYNILYKELKHTLQFFKLGQPPYSSTTTYYGKTMVGALREENNQIYRWEIGAPDGFVFYDFTLKLGDSISYYYNNVFSTNYVWLKKIDSVQLDNGEHRRRFLFSFQKNTLPTNMDYAVIWIEGLGRVDGDLMNYTQQTRYCDNPSGRVCRTHRFFHACKQGQRLWGSTPCDDTLAIIQYPQLSFAEFSTAKWIQEKKWEHVKLAENITLLLERASIHSVDTSTIVRENNRYRAVYHEQLDANITQNYSNGYKADTSYTRTPRTCIGGFREAGQKIYCWDDTLQVSYLLCDFAAKVQDIVSLNYPSRDYLLERIDSSLTTVHGVEKKNYTYNWIELSTGRKFRIQKLYGSLYEHPLLLLRDTSYLNLYWTENQLYRKLATCIDDSLLMQNPIASLSCDYIIAPPKQHTVPYTPFMPQNNAKWATISQVIHGTPSDYSYEKWESHESISLLEKTIAPFSRTYKGVYRSRTRIHYTATDTTYYYEPQTCVGGFYEAYKKIYYWDNDTQKEYLLYDFTLSVGDTFRAWYSSASYVIHRIDSVQLENSPQWVRRYHFLNDTHTDTFRICEGYGTLTHFPMFPWGDTLLTDSLWQNTTQISHILCVADMRVAADYKPGNEITCNYEVPRQPPGALTAYPNPAQTTVTLYFTRQMRIAPLPCITITDIHGEVKYTAIVTAATHTFSIETLPAGIYFCHYTNVLGDSQVTKLIVQ